MARALAWSQAAVRDLDAALEFVAEVSPFFAAALALEARTASRSLSEFPERGRIVPELGHESIRELFVRDHRMIYRVEPDQVAILAFFHGRRDFDRAWHERPRSR